MTDPIAFRRSLGRFATGVTVVTCAAGGGRPSGLTVNSFSSVSLDPPLVLWNIANVSRTLEDFLAAGYFGVNLLYADQRDVAAHFARSEGDLFADVEYALSPAGVPRLSRTLAWFECRRAAVHEGGDHFIVVGEVVDFDCADGDPADGDPLVFFDSRYRRLAPD